MKKEYITRSGDSRVIGNDGKFVNVDAEAREKAARQAEHAAQKAPVKSTTKAAKTNISASDDAATKDQ